MEKYLKQKSMKLDIQKFAEGEGETTPTEPIAGAEPKEPSFQELLDNNKGYKSDFDRAISKATETAVKNAKSEWDKEQAQKVAESQKLAQMDELQKKDYEIDRLNKELAKRDADTQATNLMNEAIKQANEKGIPLEIMTALDYKNETAETISKKIEIYAKAFQNNSSKAIEEYSKEPTPQTGDRKGPVAKELKDCKTYEEIAKYYEEHPEME